MGLFDFLFGKRKFKVKPTVVWLNREAKANGLESTVKELAAADVKAVVLIAHFDETLDALSQIAAAYSGHRPPVISVLADDMEELLSTLAARDDELIEVLVAEIHPLLRVEDRLTQQLKMQECRVQLERHAALTEPPIDVFVGDGVTELLGKMGMDADTPIRSALVGRRIEQAQRKLAETLDHNIHPASSAAEWMDKNAR